ncbi:hypothetical protein DIPPA_18070 [Diplonema papillatum]|nr:hypothetical protein DIPPA_18070 [Diplonema papillatum]KAJ9469939.1 hypothetical protein DIPPA_18070 [Diplonema papillatum]
MPWLSSVVSQVKKAGQGSPEPAKPEHGDATAREAAGGAPTKGQSDKGVKGTFHAVVAVTSSSVGYMKRSVATLGTGRVTYIPVMPLPQRRTWSPPEIFDDSTPYDVIVASFPDPPAASVAPKPEPGDQHLPAEGCVPLEESPFVAPIPSAE